MSRAGCVDLRLREAGEAAQDGAREVAWLLDAPTQEARELRGRSSVECVIGRYEVKGWNGVL